MIFHFSLFHFSVLILNIFLWIFTILEFLFHFFCLILFSCLRLRMRLLIFSGCLLTWLLQKFKFFKSVSHFFVYLFLGSSMTSRPSSKFKLINKGPFYGFQAQAELDEGFELRRERTYLWLKSSANLFPESLGVFYEGWVVFIFSCGLLERSLACNHVEKDDSNCKNVGFSRFVGQF